MADRLTLDEVRDEIRTGLSLAATVREIDTGEYLVGLPFCDSGGDPIELTADARHELPIVDDGGAIAGLLFSLGQHEEGSPGYRLVMQLAEAHDLRVDFDRGLVWAVFRESLYETVAEVAKVVISVFTVLHHIRDHAECLADLDNSCA